MSAPRILLTAFEPFDGTGLNASLQGCRAFLERWEAELPVEFAVLPVEYGPDVEVVEATIGSRHPDVVLHTGQSHRTASIRVECTAVNRRYPPAFHPLDGGPRDRPDPIPIDPDGPERLDSTLPCATVVAAIEAEGIAAELSDDAGIYLCNHALYRSLQRIARLPRAPQIGFLHVPRLPEQVSGSEPCMPAEDIGRAIYAAVRACGVFHTET